jgi:serine/threonine-protein kinase
MMQLDDLLAALSPLLDHAAELAPDARAAWLAGLHREQPEIAGELEALLRTESSVDAGRLLHQSLAADLLAMPPAGGQVGPYALVGPLGYGGMGTVWLGRRNDGRYEGQVAVKLLSGALLHAAGAERFRREADALARLTHPNIARLLDAGVSAAGQPYLVLEYVDGIRLDRFADERRLSPASRLALLLQVIDAVSHAHANLIVHRDIKPSNLLVTPEGTVKLLDFGIAKLLVSEGSEGERSLLTEAAGSALTPEYAAPEQVTGAPVTVATDVYALGVLMYVLLSGRHPTGEDAVTPAQHLQRLVDVTPTRLSSAVGRPAEGQRDTAAVMAANRGASPERLRRLYHGDLDNIVAKALKKSPNERYGTVAALADDIRRYLRDEPVQARPDTLGYRTRKFVRRNRAAVGAAVVAATLLVASTGYALYQLGQAERERDEARVQRDRAVLERQRSAASDNFMQAVLSTVGPSERITAAELLERGRGLIEKASGRDPRVMAPLMIQLATQFHFVAGPAGIDAEGRLLERGAEFARASGDPELRATAECSLGLYAGRTLFDMAAAEAHWEAASRLLRAVARPDPDVVITCLLAEAYTAAFRGNTDSATRLLRTFDSMAAGKADSMSLTAAQHRYDAANVWVRLGRIRAVLAEARRCDDVLLRLGHASSMFHLSTLALEYFALTRLGEYRTADSVNAMWLEIARRHGPDLAGFIEVHAAYRASWIDRPDSAARIWQRRLASARRAGTVTEGTLYPLIRALTAARMFREAHARLVEYGRRADAAPLQLLALRGRLAEAEGRLPEARHDYDSLLRVPDSAARSGRVSDFWPVLIWDAGVALADRDLGAADSLAREALVTMHQHEHDDLRSGDVGRVRLLQAKIALARADSISAARLIQLALPPLEYGLGTDRPETLAAHDLAVRLSGR